MIRSPVFAVLGVFGFAFVLAIYVAGSHEGAVIAAAFFILAGQVVGSLDRHMRDNQMSKELKENTDLTKQVPGKVAQEASKVAEKLVVVTEKAMDKIDAKQIEVAEVIADKTSDTYQKAFKQGYEAGQEALRREMESRRPPSF